MPCCPRPRRSRLCAAALALGCGCACGLLQQILRDPTPPVGGMPVDRGTRRRRAKLRDAGGADEPASSAASAAGDASGARPAVAPRAAAAALPAAKAIEPTGEHTATVILLHGLGDDPAYWAPFHSALSLLGPASRGVRWLALAAPTRRLWRENMTAWFQYLTERSGEDKEDEINEEHLESVRAALHHIIQREGEALVDAGGVGRVLLAGSSQGGSCALDAALTLPGSPRVAGVAMLRSLALGATALAARARADGGPAAGGEVEPEAGAGGRLPLLAVSGEEDPTFALPLVQRQLKKLSQVVCVDHEVVPGLDHDTDYDAREVRLFLGFVAERLGLLGAPGAPAAELPGLKAISAVLPEVTVNTASWDHLTERQRSAAVAMGIRGPTAWDEGTAPVWQKRWAKLSDHERRAAHRLGFTEQLWDSDGRR